MRSLIVAIVVAVTATLASPSRAATRSSRRRA